MVAVDLLCVFIIYSYDKPAGWYSVYPPERKTATYKCVNIIHEREIITEAKDQQHRVNSDSFGVAAEQGRRKQRNKGI